MPDILERIDARLVIAGEFWEDKDRYLKMIEEYDLAEMRKFVEDNSEKINQIRLEGYDKYPSEFF